MSELLDDQGRVYRQGGFDGQWHNQQGLFGTERNTDLFGKPNLQCNLFGQPEQARTVLGTPIYSDDGRPLYKPASSASSWSGSGGGGDALAAFLAIGLLILSVLAIAALFSVFVKLLQAIVDGYRDLVKRHPRGMFVFHMALGMLCVGVFLWFIGLPWYTQLAGAGVIPLTWGWLKLTQRLPLVFMPINCAAAGVALWFASNATRHTWEGTWSRLSVGLSFIGNLPLVLAFLPLTLWLWTLGAHRFPKIFLILGRLIFGALLWFGLMRAWTDWLPYWESFVSPISPLLWLTGWLIFLLPLTLWLWVQGQARWPLPFTALNLLLFGVLLGLAAFHTQSAWIEIWYHWMKGLPFVSAPILTITLFPVAFWGWGLAVNNWRRWLAIPNALLTGGILWLILDRTRLFWEQVWEPFWGPVPLIIDPALVLLFAPLVIWVWKKGAARWPKYWGAFRALLWGGALWWLVERTRSYWALDWIQFAGSGAPDPALLAFLSIPAAWAWGRLSKRWPRFFTILGWSLVTLWLFWFAGRMFPLSGFAFRGGIAVLPLAIYVWFALLIRRPWIALGIVGIPGTCVLLLYYFIPDTVLDLLRNIAAWLLSQGLPFWLVSSG